MVFGVVSANMNIAYTRVNSFTAARCLFFSRTNIDMYVCMYVYLTEDATSSTNRPSRGVTLVALFNFVASCRVRAGGGYRVRDGILSAWSEWLHMR